MTRPVRQHRRKFIKQTAALSAAAATGTLGFPAIVRSQGGPLKVGVLHPVTGPLAYSGNLSRLGAKIAIDEINAAGGIKALGGAKIEPIYADAPQPAGGRRGGREDERGRRERHRRAPTPARSASQRRRPRPSTTFRTVVDVGVADQIVQRGLKNTFRFGPGYREITDDADQRICTS